MYNVYICMYICNTIHVHVHLFPTCTCTCALILYIIVQSMEGYMYKNVHVHCILLHGNPAFFLESKKPHALKLRPLVLKVRRKLSYRSRAGENCSDWQWNTPNWPCFDTKGMRWLHIYIDTLYSVHVQLLYGSAVIIRGSLTISEWVPVDTGYVGLGWVGCHGVAALATGGAQCTHPEHHEQSPSQHTHTHTHT